jgi:hypothetical protein
MSAEMERVRDHSLSLKDLPEHLDFVEVSQDDSKNTDESDCSICLRTFNDPDEPSEIADGPCQPMRIDSCNHVIGSTCLKKLLDLGMRHCPMCRTRIRSVPGTNPTPFWIRWLLNSQQFPFSSVSLWIRMARRGLACKDDENGDQEFDELHTKLLEGKMNDIERRRLWVYYMRVPTADTPVAVLFVFAVIAICWSAEYLLVTYLHLPSSFDRMRSLFAVIRPNSCIPTLFLGAILLFAGDAFFSLPRQEGTLQWPRWTGVIAFAISAICFSRALPLWLVFLITISDCLTFGVVVWVLIGVGMRKRRYW